MAGKTIIDIAREAGVSFKTVSRVINREPTVKKETREKVEAVIARLNYKPNAWARALAGSRNQLIGIICNDARLAYGGSAYLGLAQVGAMNACQRAGYHLVVEELRGRPRKRFCEGIAELQLGGAILAPPVSDDKVVLDALSKAGLPFIRMSAVPMTECAGWVGIDEVRAAYEMTRYLLDLGHRDIAFVRGPSSHVASALRQRGFTEAMEGAGADLRAEWIVDGDFTARGGMEAGMVLLEGKRRPTAVFAGNDSSALGVISAAYRSGLSLPSDLSVAGFDDSPIATSVWPQLTTVRQPVMEMAQLAIEMLVEVIARPAEARGRQLDFEIVVRGSTAPPQAIAAGRRRRTAHK